MSGSTFHAPTVMTEDRRHDFCSTAWKLVFSLAGNYYASRYSLASLVEDQLTRELTN